MGTVDSEIIMERIFSLWDEGIKDDEIIINTIGTEFNIERDDAESLLELTQSGCIRAGFIFNGNQYPKSNLNNHPVVRSAIKIALTRLGRPDLYQDPVKMKNPWWRFW